MNLDKFQLEVSWRQFRYALSSLSWISIPPPDNCDDGDVSRSLLFHSAAGLAIGVALTAILIVLLPANATIGAAVVLIAWIILSGMLHLVHVPGAIQEWARGFVSISRESDSDSETTERTVATIAIAGILIIKFSALNAAIADGEWAGLIVACIAARASVAGLMLSTGIREPFSYGGLSVIDVDQNHMYIALLIAGALCILISGLEVFVLIVICALIVYGCHRRLNRDNLGVSGGTCHALVEIVEVVALCVVAL